MFVLKRTNIMRANTPRGFTIGLRLFSCQNKKKIKKSLLGAKLSFLNVTIPEDKNSHQHQPIAKYPKVAPGEIIEELVPYQHMSTGSSCVCRISIWMSNKTSGCEWEAGRGELTTRGASWRGRKLQPSLTLHCKELLLCGPTRVHLRGRLGEKELEIRMRVR